jgi:hypothetical protein
MNAPFPRLMFVAGRIVVVIAAKGTAAVGSQIRREILRNRVETKG